MSSPMMLGLDIPSEIEGTVDVAIIGAGPAGMTAAVYAARKRLKTAIITKDVGGQVAWTLGIENYPGYQYITGRELTSKFQEQVQQFPVPILLDEAKEIKRNTNTFTIVTSGDRSVEARTIIIATGKRSRELGVPNEKSLVGHGVSYCSTCDGPLFGGKDVAICGGSNSAISAAIDMSGVAARVFVVSRSPWRADAILLEKVDQKANIVRRVGYDILEIIGDEVVRGLRIRDKKTEKEEILDVQGVFVEIGLDPNSEFVKELLKLNENEEIIVDCMCKTDIPGIYAAGDVTMVHEKQIVVAAGEGAKAAMSAYEYLLRKR
jgi:alkyl hydroperoxide reductase subunit F